jgi:LysM repeat protein
MQNVRIIFIALFLLTGHFSRSQQQAVIQNYISTYKDIAIEEMQRTGVPASIKLAQGIHETMAGTSELVVKSNNHFGIKCKANWTGESVSHDDDLRGECFRKYKSPEDSYRDHSNFLKNGQRYASLFKLDPLNYTGWAYGLKKAGYATNPKYPQVIIKLIEDYNLQDYTLFALGKGPLKEEILVSATTAEKENVIEPSMTSTGNERSPENTMTETKISEKRRNYPSGEFRINETRVIYARQGTSLLSIAQQHKISLARIFEFNDMKESETLSKDQLIYLQRKRKTGHNEFHTVMTGETLHDIAQEEAIRMDVLLEYNQLQGSMKPAPGEILYLRKKAPLRPAIVIQDQLVFARNDNADNVIARTNAVQTASKTESFITHTVQSKETVYSISKKYNVRMDEIAEWNRLSSYELKTGQQLKIYK